MLHHCSELRSLAAAQSAAHVEAKIEDGSVTCSFSDGGDGEHGEVWVWISGGLVGAVGLAFRLAKE